MALIDKLKAIGDAIREKTGGVAKMSLPEMAQEVRKIPGMVVSSADGSNISLNDSTDLEVQSLRLFGKTTQNGIPTPESPIELDNCGNDGNIKVSVVGKNLFGGVFGNNFPLFIPKGTTVTASTLAGAANSYFYLLREDGTVVEYGSVMDSAGDRKYRTFTASEDIYFVKFLTNETGEYQIELGSAVTEYEPYKNPQILTIATPNGLPGIPVTSGGNYTDEAGRQWVCDEIDFANSVYIQRVYARKLNADSIGGAYNANAWGKNAVVYFKINDTFTPFAGTGSMSDMFTRVSHPDDLNNSEGICLHPTLDNYIYLGVAFEHLGIEATTDAVTGVNAIKTFLNENSVTVLHKFINPIETALSAEELAAYAAMHTNYPNTTIFNDSGAYMALEYVVEPKNRIDTKETLLKSVIEKSAIDIFSLPTNIEKIGPCVFRAHPNIKFTTLPNGVKEIGTQAFAYCNTLRRFTLPATVTQLDNQVFYNCTNLKEVSFLGKPSKISTNVFQNCENLTTINVAWAEGEVANAPWGATNATINYNYTGV